MEEQRKYAVLFAATILAARKLNEIGAKPCPARECVLTEAIQRPSIASKRLETRWVMGAFHAKLAALGGVHAT